MGDHSGLLHAVGAHVRGLREQRGMTRKSLAERSGLSERFLAKLESGAGNISLSRFADLAEALGQSSAELLTSATQRRNAIALLGVRGAGKSTIGARLARALGVPFIELDDHVEEAAELSLGQIFELHGEDYYRRLQHQALRSITDGQSNAVIATGGSIVADDACWSLLRERTHTIWLRATAREHWDRVVAQGDQRPMAKSPHAFAELEALLAERDALYQRAQTIIDTSGKSVDAVATEVRDAVALRS